MRNADGRKRRMRKKSADNKKRRIGVGIMILVMMMMIGVGMMILVMMMIGKHTASEFLSTNCANVYYINSLARCQAALTACITVERKEPSSKAAMPAMVVPPGEQTMSFSSPGCLPLSRTIDAEPKTVWAA